MPERAAWIRAINKAMVGKFHSEKDTIANGGSLSSPSISNTRQSPIQKYDGLRDIVSLTKTTTEDDACQRFASVCKSVLQAKNKVEYTDSLMSLWGNTLRLPINWIEEALVRLDDDMKPKNLVCSLDRVTTLDLWGILSRESYFINGYKLKGGSGYGPERIVGVLVRCILEHDRTDQISELLNTEHSHHPACTKRSCKSSMTEVQAISYARDVLLMSYPERCMAHSIDLVEHLCLVPNLVHLTPLSSRNIPVKISVSHYDAYSAINNEKLAENEQEKSAWLITWAVITILITCKKK